MIRKCVPRSPRLLYRYTMLYYYTVYIYVYALEELYIVCPGNVCILYKYNVCAAQPFSIKHIFGHLYLRKKFSIFKYLSTQENNNIRDVYGPQFFSIRYVTSCCSLMTASTSLCDMVRF